ncbi:MAG: uridine kinase [Vicinamibacteria bacterium]|jgi:uridine kinase|nr:uridine kinase [Vicinamibacteria bacterium]
MAILIGVAGGTGSGKTSFARKLVEAIGEESCLMVPQDSYYRDTSSLTAEERARWNYDHPHAFDTSLLEQDLRELKMSRPVPHLTYDYATHARIVQPDALRPRPVIVLEGILVLAEESLRRIMDIRLFIDTDADVRILRRLRRDLKERGRSYDSVEKQYLESVRMMHLEFVEPSKRYADLIIPEGAQNNVALDAVIARVQAMVASRAAAAAARAGQAAGATDQDETSAT